MLKLLLSLFLLVGFNQAQHKKIVSAKVISDVSHEQPIEVKAEVEDNILKLTIKKKDDVQNFEVDLNNQEGLETLEDILEDMDIDVDIDCFATDWSHMKKMERGAFLGVHVSDLSDQLRNYFKVKGDGGVLISEVVDDSPAKKSGLKAGDIILSVNDDVIDDANGLTKTIRGYDPETEVTVTVLRKGREQKFKVALGETEFPRYAWFGKKDREKFKHHLKAPKKKREMYFFHDDEDEEHADYFPPSMKKELDELREEIEQLKKELKKLKKS